MEIPVNDASKLPEDEAARQQAELIQGTPPESEMPGQTDLASPAEVSDSLGDSGALPEVTPVSAESETPEVGSSTDKSEMVAPPEDTSIAPEQADDPLLERSAMEAPAEDAPHPTEEIDNTHRGNFERFIPTEGPETTEVPVVNVGNAIDTPEADREQSSEQTEEAPAEDTRIEDRDEAEEYARAAKPFDDAKVEKADKLDEEQQETLSWLSSEAGEEAARTYRESKKQMTEAEMAIKEHFEPIRHIAYSEESNWEKEKAKFGARKLTEEERDKIYALTETLLQEVVDDQFESIMLDEEATDRDKLEGVQQLAIIRDVLRDELNINQGMVTNQIIGTASEIAHRFEHQPEMLRSILWGKFIAGAVQDRGFFSIDSLEQISKLTGQPFETLFDKVHDTFVEANANSVYKSATDQALDRQGYLWSPSRNRYVKISE